MVRLLEATPPEDLVLAGEGAGFELDGDGVLLTLADGRRERGDVLVGADGSDRRFVAGCGPAIRRRATAACAPCVAWSAVSRRTSAT